MNPLELLESINTFVFDFDGVLTNGTMILTEGEERRSMNIYDGFALKQAAESGYKIFVISGSQIPGARTRLARLGVNEMYFGVHDKKELLLTLLNKYQIERNQVLYMGDDLPDYHAMHVCGVKVCPPNAMPEIYSSADIITEKKGGEGAVREIIEKVLRIQGHWPTFSEE